MSAEKDDLKSYYRREKISISQNCVRYQKLKPYCQRISLNAKQKNFRINNKNKIIQQKQSHQFKSCSFGSNREQAKFQNYLKMKQETPSPADYQIKKRNFRMKAYSLRPRIKNYFDMLIDKSLLPYPGYYYDHSNEMGEKFRKLKEKLSNKQKVHKRNIDINSKNLQVIKQQQIMSDDNKSENHIKQQQNTLKLKNITNRMTENVKNNKQNSKKVIYVNSLQNTQQRQN